MLRGVAHDPTARRMGSITGHAVWNHGRLGTVRFDVAGKWRVGRGTCFIALVRR
jgi:hypothetical protein